jgi:hypothetical protein
MNSNGTARKIDAPAYIEWTRSFIAKNKKA